MVEVALKCGQLTVGDLRDVLSNAEIPDTMPVLLCLVSTSSRDVSHLGGLSLACVAKFGDGYVFAVCASD